MRISDWSSDVCSSDLADHNGRPYVSIGQWLAKKGELPLAQASMQNIKTWARSHPSRVQEMLNANPAMVFFNEEAVTDPRSEEHTSELQSLMRISYAVFCLNKKLKTYEDRKRTALTSTQHNAQLHTTNSCN